MSRIDYYDDPSAPAPNAIVAAVSAVVEDSDARILLHRRADNDLWALPGGALEMGESISAAIVREVNEETGIDVSPKYITGVYSDPKHVFAYDDGEVRQEFSVCIACDITGGALRVSDESREVRFVEPKDLLELPMHPRIRIRVTDYLAGARGALR